jgi:DNA adenine methylase
MIKAPFPWFGGKSRAADLIWSRFGSDIGNYVEPFLGSAAVWLNRPAAFEGWAALNDKDGFVANFWRATQVDPEAVAAAADWPVSEVDLHARHLWLVNNRDKLTARLLADPNFYDAQVAGWWAWGLCTWIGGGWCDGNGSWRAEPDEDGVMAFTQGNGGQGVKRRLPHLGDGGKGVQRRLPCLNNPMGLQTKRNCLTDWFATLADQLKGARVTCGDWERVCSPPTMTRNGVCGVLLDPPYSTTEPVYAQDGREISAVVREWCVANQDNPRLRIALCGHAGEHELPGWDCMQWQSGGGYQGADDRERIWFSPACLRRERELFDL